MGFLHSISLDSSDFVLIHVLLTDSCEPVGVCLLEASQFLIPHVYDVTGLVWNAALSLRMVGHQGFWGVLVRKPPILCLHSLLVVLSELVILDSELIMFISLLLQVVSPLLQILIPLLLPQLLNLVHLAGKSFHVLVLRYVLLRSRHNERILKHVERAKRLQQSHLRDRRRHAMIYLPPCADSEDRLYP